MAITLNKSAAAPLAAVAAAPASSTIIPKKTTTAAPMTLPTIQLPTQKSQIKQNLGEYTWLIHGQPKSGKTSLAAQFPDALFLMMEPGGKGLEIYELPITDWKQIKEVLQQIKTGNHKFKTVVFDTVDILAGLCILYTCMRSGGKHPQDIKNYGKIYDDIELEFNTLVLDFAATGIGLVFISHSKVSTFTRPDDSTFNRIIPSANPRLCSFLTGWADIIAFYGYEGMERKLIIQGGDTVEAGHRIDGKFLVKGTEEKVISIPMGKSAKEAYQNVQLAFDNRQETPNTLKKSIGLTVKQKKEFKS